MSSETISWLKCTIDEKKRWRFQTTEMADKRQRAGFFQYA